MTAVGVYRHRHVLRSEDDVRTDAGLQSLAWYVTATGHDLPA